MLQKCVPRSNPQGLGKLALDIVRNFPHINDEAPADLFMDNQCDWSLPS